MKVFEILDPAKMFGGFNLMGIGDEKAGSLVDKAADMLNPNRKGDSEPAPSNEVVIIGDSIAVGMGGSEPYAKGGISTTEVLNRVNAFIKTGKAKGAVVILSSGASNSAPIELEGGTTQSGNLSPVAQQLAALKAAGASVALVGTGSKKSAWFPPTKYTNGKRYRIDLTGVNQQLSSMASSNGAKFLGPLEEYDSGMHSGKGDGVHPFGAYQKLKQSGATSFPTRKSAPASNSKKTAPASGKGAVNPNDIKSYLGSKGLDRNQVAGIMANIKAESSFRPGAIGDNGTSGGLFQHHKERFAAMKAAAGKDWATNWKGQIDFALTEPAGRQYAGMKFSSPEAASKWFTINFERPANMVAKANTRSADAASYA